MLRDLLTIGLGVAPTDHKHLNISLAVEVLKFWGELLTRPAGRVREDEQHFLAEVLIQRQLPFIHAREGEFRRTCSNLQAVSFDLAVFERPRESTTTFPIRRA